MKIYLDYNIGSPLGMDWYTALDENIQDVPHNVDLIGLTFFYHDIDKIRPIIDIALEKSQYVIVYFCEFNGPDVVKFEQEYHEKFPNLQIFANAVTHYSSRLKHIGEWFMQLNNPYSTEAWAMDLLTRLNDDHHCRLHKFDCLLGKQTPARDFIATMILHQNPSDDFIFSYFKDNIHNGIWQDIKLDDVHLSSNRVLYQGSLTSVSNILPVDIYNDSYYSIVADTMCPSEFNFYTEKIAKPMIAGRLFVAFAGHRYLENLRSIGFRTFDGIIDESYDAISDSQHRWSAAWSQVEFLLSQDPMIIMEKIQPIVNHNRDLILSTDWANPIRDYINNVKSSITSRDL